MIPVLEVNFGFSEFASKSIRLKILCSDALAPARCEALPLHFCFSSQNSGTIKTSEMKMLESPVIKTDFKNLTLVHRGKVRDLYEVEDKLLMVATDRISAFDVVMDDPIPHKGKVLTKLSLFWCVHQNHKGGGLMTQMQKGASLARCLNGFHCERQHAVLLRSEL